MRRHLILPTVGTLAALTLTGCGADTGADATGAETTTAPTSSAPTTSAPSPTPELISTAEGEVLEWASMGGATGTLTFHAAPDPLVERYRALEGRNTPVVWADVDIDNRSGTDTVSVYDIALYTESGDEIIMTAADQAVTEWANALNETNPDAYTGELYDLAWEIEQDDVNAGQRATHKALLEGELPEQVTRVALILEGGEEVEVYPEGKTPTVNLSNDVAIPGPTDSDCPDPADVPEMYHSDWAGICPGF